MSISKLAGPARGRRARVIHVTPITRAVRHALAVSATALALAGPAAAATPCAPAGCASSQPAAILAQAAVQDLTVVRARPAVAAMAQAMAVSSAGDVEIENEDALSAAGVGSEDVSALSGDAGGSLAITNSGALDAVAGSGRATGLLANAVSDMTIVNTGAIVASGSSNASGISATAGGGISLVNEGDIQVGAGGMDKYGPAAGFGISASGYGDAGVGVVNHGDLVVGGMFASGVAATNGNGAASVTNTGAITANGPFGGTGLIASAGGTGTATIDNSGDIYASADKYAVGLTAQAYDGDAVVTNGGTVRIDGATRALGITAQSTNGSVSIGNDGDITITTSGGGEGYGPTIPLALPAGSSLAGLQALAGGDANVDNTAAIDISTYYGDAIGIDARGTGAVRVDNSGAITVSSQYGLADGIFATGSDVGVTNSGDIYASGYNWAVGIEAQGDVVTTVINDGTINATASALYAPYGTATGIYATAGTGGATITNSGSIGASGVYAAGVDVISGGAVSVTNAGDIVVGSGFNPVDAGTNYYAAGIRAATNYDGADIVVANTGLIEVGSVLGSTGIDVSAVGQGSQVSVDNSGDILVSASYRFGTADGIVASGDSGASVTTSGSVTAVSAGDATGASALSFAGNTDIVNAGDIVVQAGAGGTATGLVAATENGTATAINDGLVRVDDGLYAFGAQVDGLSGATFANSGTVQVGGRYSYGVLVLSSQGDALADNAADALIDSYGYAFALGMGGIATLGDAVGSNAGTVHAFGGGQALAAYERSREGDARLDNTGTIVAESYGTAVAVTVGADLGNATMTNTGDVIGLALDRAFGASVVADYGLASVANDGAINAFSYYGAATAIQAGGLTVDVRNAGATAAASYYDSAFGIVGVGDEVTVSNDGSVGAYGSLLALGIVGEGRIAALTNAGDITVEGLNAIGAGVYGTESAILDNAGDVVATGTNTATGVRIAAPDVQVGNSGSLSAIQSDATYAGQAIALYAYGDAVTVDNSGDLVADSAGGQAVGLFGNAYTVDVASSGSITATGIAARGAMLGGVSVNAGNTGDIVVDGDMVAIGVEQYSVEQGVFNNGASGSIVATSANGDALGVYAYGAGISVSNAGTVSASASGYAGGLVATSDTTATLTNSGTVAVAGDDIAAGIGLVAMGDATVVNSGVVQATSTNGTAAGVAAGIDTGVLVVDNRGTITATGSEAIGVDFFSAGTLLNTGTVRAVQDEAEGIVVRGDDAIQDVRNAGTLDGAIDLGGGDDRFTNAAGGLWRVTGDLTDFGAGDDMVRNLAGGTIELAGGTISLGSSTAGNSFLNQGLVHVAGVGYIDMGSGAAGAGTNALAFTNSGVLDLYDGAADDQLTITGNLTGQGALAIDLIDGEADQLVVDGSVATGAVQTVNLRYDVLPTASTQPVVFATVSGDSSASSFVAGKVVNTGMGDFIDLSVNVTSQITAGEDVFMVGLEMNGLSDSGRLAASVAPGMLRLVDAQIGTWRERMGFNPELGDGRVGLGPWVRTYADHGNVQARQVGGNFDQGGALAFRQANHGTDVGFDAHVGAGVHVGVLMGKAYGTQRMADGTNRLDGDTSGVYATWFSDNGAYVDASYRWMGFDARLASAGVSQRTRGDAGAFNVEAGWTAWRFGGIALTPQVQYTQAHVNNIDVLQGPSTDFVIGNTDSRRARLGVEASGRFGEGAIRWTPYAAVSAVREFDGEASYAVSDTLFATNGIKGTSAKVDLGIGAQFKGVSLAAGASWLDGGAVQDTVGGQLVLRYTW